MDSVTVWTGRTACALQAALRLSNESFAEHLGIAVRTVAAWHHKPTLKPKSEMQQLLDTALEQASPAVTTRFTQYLAGFAPRLTTATRENPATADAQQRLRADPYIGAALDWLDRSAGWTPGASRDLVASRLTTLNVRDLQDRGSRRRRVNQRHIGHALSGYYRTPLTDHGQYTARYSRDREAVTSILTRPGWLDLDCPLPARTTGSPSPMPDPATRSHWTTTPRITLPSDSSRHWRWAQDLWTHRYTDF